MLEHDDFDKQFQKTKKRVMIIGGVILAFQAVVGLIILSAAGLGLYWLAKLVLI